jgi:hypothetical protein
VSAPDSGTGGKPVVEVGGDETKVAPLTASAGNDDAAYVEDGYIEGDYVDTVFGGTDKRQTVVSTPANRTSFAPWHHPVKQIVRDYQWADLVRKLLAEHRQGQGRESLRYFTLPGADLLDVRVLAEAVADMGTRIEYFGFDSGYEDQAKSEIDLTGAYLLAESALRQSGSISDRAEILRDRLEDIAQPGTHAAERLRQRGVFDVINIDACDHLGYKPEGRTGSVFEAIEKLLEHQLWAKEPWLLFITTRANVALLGTPATKLQYAIMRNIDVHQEEFSAPLAECIGAEVATIAADLAGCWTVQNLNFLKLFSVGLSKYLLHFYHAQQNIRTKVELASAFAYKVSGDEPDMLSLAFRMTPKGLNVLAPSAGGGTPLPTVELSHALGMVSRAKKLWDLDQAIASDQGIRTEAVVGTEKLLSAANYDIPKWREWLRTLPVRPMTLDDAA